MTKAQGNTIIILLLIALGAPFWVVLKPFTKWEYLQIDIAAVPPSEQILLGLRDDNLRKLLDQTVSEIDEKLNAYGKEGWELVSITTEHQTSHPNFGKEDYVSGIQPNVRPQKVIALLKRQLRW